ncbi:MULTISPECIES: hypothetical protein [unclassified Chelatococcus]|uniref:hypothetical protein n=1 Tax=unclassified Chelatococcus TaxID=2638111 RepID=UPI001BCBAE92|nr:MULTISPECIES: hypothetical protein [unclassified Chelatococcus]MBS7700767.1 hypothetical protein [Chelatococcus sp. YT9]MBX3559351.1 hypothetical protein [Chelatococcus sp.]
MGTATDAPNPMAWRDFVMWAYDNDIMRHAFQRETGIMLAPQDLDMLSKMIVDALGKTSDDIIAFMSWVSVRYYGLEHVPDQARTRVEDYLRANPSSDGWARTH